MVTQVKLIFDDQFVGQEELVISTTSTNVDRIIPELFEKFMDIPYNEETCFYEIL